MKSKKKKKLNWRAGGILTVLVTVICFYLSFSPSISVHVGSNLNQFDPFQTTFILRNNYWLFTITNIQRTYSGNHFVFSDGSEIHARTMVVPDAIISSIGSQKEYTFLLNMNLLLPTNSISSAETTIDIAYDIWFITMHDSFKFKVFKNSAGVFEWSPMS